MKILLEQFAEEVTETKSVAQTQQSWETHGRTSAFTNLIPTWCNHSDLGRTGHKLLPPYIRVIQGDGVDYQSIPKILQRFKDMILK